MPKFVTSDSKNDLPVVLRLKEIIDGVNVIALDAKGNPWTLFSLSNEGIVRRSRNVTEGLGLRLDTEGRVIFVDS